MPKIDPGQLQFKFLANGVVKAGGVNLSTDLIPVLKLLGNIGQITTVNFQTAVGAVTPPPTPPPGVAPVNTVVPTVSPASGPVGTVFTASAGTWTGTPAPHLTGKWQFNGVDILNAAGYIFTATSAEIGVNKLRFVEHGTNGTAPAADANSTAKTVTAATSDIPLANQAAMIAMLAAGTGSSGNKSYMLAPGNYDANDWTYDYSTAPIVIKGQAGVIFTSGIRLNGCKGFTLQSIPSFAGLFAGNYALNINNCVNIIIDSCGFLGNTPGAPHDGVAIFARDSDQVTLSNNTITMYGAGIVALDCTNINTIANHITKISANFIFQTSVQGAIIQGNYGGNLDFQEPGAHTNWIHIASTGSTGRSNNVVVRNNNWDRRLGGIATNGFVYGYESSDNITDTGNAGFGGGDNGNSYSDCTNVICSDNYEQGWDFAPRIYCRDGHGMNDNIAMTNSYCSIAPFALTPNPPTNVTISGNTVIPQAASSADTARYLAFLAAHPSIPTS